MIEGVVRYGEAIARYRDFGEAYYTSDPILICNSDHVILHRVYEESRRFFAERLKISLGEKFDASGIFVKTVRVYKKEISGGIVACEKMNTNRTPE